MRTKHLLLAALSAMTALSACNDEDTFAAQPDAACLQVNATMAGASTRAAIEGTELPQGAQIGVSVFNSDGSNYNGKTDGCLNIPYTRQTGWETRNPISLSHTVGKAVAYYPYSPGVGNISTIPVETESQTDYLYSDWVNDLTYQNNQANFSMNHALCAIQLNLVNESYEADKGEVTSLAVTSDDLATKGTLNAMTGALSAFSGQGTRIAVNKTFLLSKEVQSTKIIGIPTGHRGLEARRHPDLTVEVTIDGKRNKLTVPMVKAFEQGMAYEVNMKVKDTQNPLELVSVTVKPWVEEILGDVDMYQDNAYIIQVKIPSDGFEFGTNATNFTGTIDWGDGTEPDSYTYEMEKPWHTYAKAGTYTVVHKGKTEKLEFAYTKANSPACLRDILYIGKDLGINNMQNAFFDCFNLQNLRPGIFDNLTQVTSFKETFSWCSKITAIPVGLFDHCTKVTDFSGTFGACSALTAIPQGLFDKCTNATSFSATFFRCSKITAIPVGLFDKNINVRNFNETFGGYNVITGINGTWRDGTIEMSLSTIPNGLFKNCSKAESFDRTFWACTKISIIPADLFKNCSAVKSFKQTFQGCSNLQTIPDGLFDDCVNVEEFYETFCQLLTCRSANGPVIFRDSQLRYIPEGLFKNCRKVKMFKSVFIGCNNLAEIPAGLFDNCTEVTSFYQTFSGDGSVYNHYNGTTISVLGSNKKIKSIPDGLFDNCPNVTDFNSTFRGCGALTAIPAGLFNNCTQVTDFQSTFGGCSSLTAIPQGLFDKCTNVTNFESTFEGCSSLTAIPQGLFDNCTKVAKFIYTFERCSSLTAIPQGLFDNCTKVMNFQNTFYGCPSLTAIPAGLFDNNTQVTSFYRTFKLCYSLTSIPQGLFNNCKKVTNFYETFCGCTSLTGESPYTMVANKKVHLYERKDYPDIFTAPTWTVDCFQGCENLTDYAQIPTDWK